MAAFDTIATMIDLHHTGRPETVGACLLETPAGPVLVDPGPASTLDRLRAGLSDRGYKVSDLSALLLTHIHLDHAGGSGTLAQENPGLKVYVHELGAGHMADPSRLIRSATRLYGDQMETLWGTIEPVPTEQIHELIGGEMLDLGGREFHVAYTPGHAAHHVSYFEPDSGVAFVGDTAGLRSPPLPYVLPVTPPPEFDLQEWLDSIRRLLAWEPRAIVLTHYGPSHDARGHLRALKDGLIDWAGYGRESLLIEGTEADQLQWFVSEVTRWLRNRVPPHAAEAYLDGAGAEACWRGLMRYWKKAEER